MNYRSMGFNELKTLSRQEKIAARDAGNRIAPVILGQEYEKENYISEAVLNFEIGLERGEAFAAKKLGDIYKDIDVKRAAEYYNKAFSMGLDSAVISLAILYTIPEYNMLNYELAKKYCMEYLNRTYFIGNCKDESIIISACSVIAKTLLHDEVSEEAMTEASKYIKIADSFGGDRFTNSLLAQFYTNGLGTHFEKNPKKAIKYYEKNYDYYEIGTIYETEYNDINNALYYFRKAYKEQNSEKGLSAAYKIAAMNVFDDFKGKVDQNINEAEFYLKEILNKGILPFAEHSAIQILYNIYDYDDENEIVDKKVRLSRSKFLVEKMECLKNADDSVTGEIVGLVYNILWMYYHNCYLCEQLNEAEIMGEKVYEWVSKDKPEFSNALRLAEGYRLYLKGIKYLEYNKLENAKKFFEKSLNNGFKDASDMLNRFHTSLFGKLTFKY